MNEEKNPEIFSVKDKRRFVVNETGSAKAEEEQKPEGENNASEAPPTETKAPKEEQQTRTSPSEEYPPLPEVNFTSFIISLSQAALFHLGLIENPNTRKAERNIPLAKHTIDTIAMFEEKTKGNLSNEEKMLLESLLADLRLKYVNELNKKQQ